MADEKVGAHEAKTRFSEYLNRVRYGRERIVIQRHGRPVAALVSVEDLARLEDAAPESERERYRQALEEAGVRISYPSGEPVPRKRRRIKVKGIPLSEQIIRDRR